jgi:1-acyl-sn-glycerol-3-phosphate acyltransferase
MWIPPIGVRRVFVDPLVYLLGVLSVLLSPVLFALALIADLITRGPWRFSRMTRLFVMFMASEVVGLTAAFALWVLSGFGLVIRSPGFRRAHYRLLSWWLRTMSREIQAAFGLTIDLPRQPPIEGPIIVFSRHAGPGDSVFIASVLLHDFDRYPRVVGKKELEFSPFFDIMGHRLPMRFIRPHPKRRDLALEAVRDAASNMEDRDAFVLFPEGGNFTPKRRLRVIESFERRGLNGDADYARRLVNVLPPHPAGPIAAIEQAPEADVVFVAHTGTEDLISPSIIWRGIPFGRSIHASYWHVASSDVPASREARGMWLNRQWEMIDRWITDNRVTALGETRT